jgi:phosphatidylserine/phosphatidylglycerophosphate/cardiolipin synthase-like enzyme
MLGALAAAKRRGLDVAAILDKSQDRENDPRGRYSPAVYLAHAGIRVLIDDEPGIADDKAIVLDARAVITGSFNFTVSADARNAENVVVLASPGRRRMVSRELAGARGGVAGVHGGVKPQRWFTSDAAHQATRALNMGQL